MDEKLRILLCEDDENLGMLLREYLQAKGYSAELYPDGEAGYKAFLKNKYDLCVFDVMMDRGSVRRPSGCFFSGRPHPGSHTRIRWV